MGKGPQDPALGPLGMVAIDVDRRQAEGPNAESNYRGILDATRTMPDRSRCVAEDGTWSLQLEIPREIDLSQDFVVEQVRGASKRTIGTVARIRPGETLEVSDSWSDVHPLNLRFVSASSQPLARVLRFKFHRKTPGGLNEETDWKC